MPTAKVYQAAANYRRGLLSRDANDLAMLAKRYQSLRPRLEGRIHDILDLIESTPIEKQSPAWLWQISRAKTALAEMEADIEAFNLGQAPRIMAAQTRELRNGAAASKELIRLGTGVNFTAPNLGAVRAFIGFTADGSPLASLLASEGAQAAATIKQTIEYALLSGRGTAAVRREIVATTEVPLLRAWRISRTETIRSYREGNYQVNQEAAEVINGWEWLAAMDGRTCAGCLAMNGRRFPNNIRMQSHVLCRCTQVPITLTAEEIMAGGAAAPITKPTAPVNDNAARYLDGMSDDRLANTLGSKAAARAYRDGAVSLPDFLVRTHDDNWGTSTGVKSLTGILGKDQARQYFGPNYKPPVKPATAPR